LDAHTRHNFAAGLMSAGGAETFADRVEEMVRSRVLQHKLDAANFSSFPTAIGTVARLASARVQAAGINSEPLLEEAGLTVEQIDDRGARLSVQRQIRFLDLAAGAVQDELLGFHLAKTCDLRELGLLYYVAASSQTLGEGLSRLARYTSINNEALCVQYFEGKKKVRMIVDYIGVPRHSDRHQIEFCLTILMRLCRHLTQSRLVPTRVRIAHRRDRALSKLAAFLGSEIEFNAECDEVAFDGAITSMPLLSADPYLNELLIAFCEEAMSRRRKTRGTFESKVENAVAPLLPHGRVGVGEIARRLGMSHRTFARQLASEGLTFTGLLETLRVELARTYLSDPALPISQIAWLLGYREVSAFTHAFKRWTGRTPSEMRSTLRASPTQALTARMQVAPDLRRKQ
jgi:AraC-like DNA-binding protein